MKSRLLLFSSGLVAAFVSFALVSQDRRIDALEVALLKFSGEPRPPMGTIQRKASEVIPTELLSLEGAAMTGSSNARIGLLQYTDFRCSYCQRFAEQTLPRIKADYINNGLVLFAVNHSPRRVPDPFASQEAEAAECARRQGKFWPMHDLLFRGPSRLDEKSRTAAAEAVGIELSDFQACMNNRAGAETVRLQADEAASLGVTGTPTFFVGLIRDSRILASRRINGAQDLSVFKGVLDGALQNLTRERSSENNGPATRAERYILK